MSLPFYLTGTLRLVFRSLLHPQHPGQRLILYLINTCCLKQRRKDGTSLYILIFLIKCGFGYISSLEAGNLLGKTTVSLSILSKNATDVLSSLASDNMRDRKYIVCFFNSQLELAVQRLSENNFAICKLKECEMGANQGE